MKLKLLTVIGIAGLAIAATATAASPGGKRFERLDANGDGKVTEAELNAQQAALIEAADANGDGALTEAEMRDYRDAKRAERRARNNPDTNNDGVVDRVEFQIAADKRFDRLDKDGDGVLSEEERERRRGHRHRGYRGE